MVPWTWTNSNTGVGRCNGARRRRRVPYLLWMYWLLSFKQWAFCWCKPPVFDDVAYRLKNVWHGYSLNTTILVPWTWTNSNTGVGRCNGARRRRRVTFLLWMFTLLSVKQWAFCWCKPPLFDDVAYCLKNMLHAYSLNNTILVPWTWAKEIYLMLAHYKVVKKLSSKSLYVLEHFILGIKVFERDVTVGDRFWQPYTFGEEDGHNFYVL